MKRKNLPPILTASETERLINAPNIATDKGKRDRAMLSLILSAGLWATELISLTVSDVSLNIRCIRINGDPVAIKPETAATLKEYIKVRESFATCDALFVNFNKSSVGQPLTRQGVWKIIKSYQKKAEINKEISPEMLRQSFAVDFLERGGDIKTLQKIMGHKHIKSTHRFEK